MGGGGSSACGVCNGLLQEMGRTLLCVSVPQHRRQPPFGRKHNFLWLVSLHVCEPHLGSHCHFHNRHEEASFVSLVQPTQLRDSSKCERSISKTFPSRKKNRRKESLVGLPRTFRLRLGGNRSRSICRSAIRL